MLKITVYIFTLLFSVPLWASDFASIQVNGKASISALPDYATITARIEHTDKTKALANSKSEQQLVKMVKALNTLGINKKAIDASNYKAYTRYQYQDGKRQKVGETSEYTIKITINNIKSLATVFHSLNQQGLSQIQPAQFYFDDIGALQQQALVKAVENAYQKAHTIAKATQQKIHSAYHIIEHDGFASPRFKMMASDSHNEAAQYQQVKAQEINARVTITYKLD